MFETSKLKHKGIKLLLEIFVLAIKYLFKGGKMLYSSVEELSKLLIAIRNIRDSS